MNKQFIFLLFTILFFVSCSEKVEKTFLSEDDFTRILFDIHLTDGVLTSKNIVGRGKEHAPSFYYNSIYKRYDITPAQFDSCVSFYTQNSGLYKEIYGRVIDSLNRLETKLRVALKDSLLTRDTVNLWKGKKQIILTREYREDLSFTIPITEMGIYTLRAEVLRHKDDRSIKPFLEAYFWKENSLKQVQKIYFDSVLVNHTDNFVRYETQLEFTDSTFKELRGNILAWDNVDSNFTQHIDLKKIMIFNPQIKRDSIGLDSLVKMQKFKRSELDQFEPINENLEMLKRLE